MRAFVDTNILVRHLTGDPPEQAARATRVLRETNELLLPDLVVAEMVYVLASFYEVPRARVAELVRAVLAFPAIIVEDPALLLRTLELYDAERLGFADAYLIAQAERSGEGLIVSFDKGLDRVGTVKRVEPPE